MRVVLLHSLCFALSCPRGTANFMDAVGDMSLVPPFYARDQPHDNLVQTN